MPSYPELKLYVGGEWRSRDGAPVINPADESILGAVPHATRADLDDALDAMRSRNTASATSTCRRRRSRCGRRSRRRAPQAESVVLTANAESGIQQIEEYVNVKAFWIRTA